jgi:hypothetical protein
MVMGGFKSPNVVLWTRKENKEYEKPQTQREREREEENWMKERMENVMGNGYV